MRACFLFFLIAFFLSCSQKLENEQEESFVYRSSAGKNPYMTCSIFADQTFQGYIYSSKVEKGCVILDISKAPTDLFNSYNRFLQIYPFKVVGNEFEYGKSLSIRTLEKHGNEEFLVQSYVIDSHIIKVDLEMEDESLFFIDHKFEICGLSDEWSGLQLVVYLKKLGEEPIPARTTKVLKPPFLVHPEAFADEYGNLLAAQHPFISYISDFKSDPKQYYDLASQHCSEF